jgi:hypothetical protein
MNQSSRDDTLLGIRHSPGPTGAPFQPVLAGQATQALPAEDPPRKGKVDPSITPLQLAVAGLHQVSSGSEVFVEDAQGAGANGAGCDGAEGA